MMPMPEQAMKRACAQVVLAAILLRHQYAEPCLGVRCAPQGQGQAFSGQVNSGHEN